MYAPSETAAAGGGDPATGVVDLKVQTPARWFQDIADKTVQQTTQMDDLWFEAIQYPPSDRLMQAEDGENVEVVGKVQGVICTTCLPPLRNMP